MRHVRNYLAIVGTHYVLYSIAQGVVRSQQQWHARRINYLQAEVAKEIDLYQNRWGKDA